MAKLTQAELDKRVLVALGEGESKEGKKPIALQKLLEIARAKKSEKESAESETK
jgi:hypothetical protein